MQFSLSRDEFVDLAERYNVVPLAVEVLGDRHTPVSVFEQLVGNDPGFLLESVEGGERWGRWSFIGWDPEFTLTSIDGVASIDDPSVAIPDGDPLDVLEGLAQRYSTPDVDALGIIHDIHDDWRSWVAPIPASVHEFIYGEIEALFVACARYRARNGLVGCRLIG